MEGKDPTEQKEKTMLDVEYTSGFSVECRNILDNPKAMQFPGWITFPIERLSVQNNTEHTDNILDMSKVSPHTTVVMVILRYFEYMCVATMSFDYLAEICKGDSQLIDVVDMMKHHLRNKLIREVDKTEQISDMYIKYTGKIRY